MNTIPHIIGMEKDYKKVQELSQDQKTLVIEALGYSLADANVSGNGVRKQILETFICFINRGEIL
jgi:hypothetical protein